VSQKEKETNRGDNRDTDAIKGLNVGIPPIFRKGRAAEKKEDNN